MPKNDAYEKETLGAYEKGQLKSVVTKTGLAKFKTRTNTPNAMNPTREHRLKALAEQSSYVENVLTHALVAELSFVMWQRDPMKPLQVFNSEVDSLGFDLVLTVDTLSRYVQLKQTHNEKAPAHCSVRLSFSKLPGACVILMSHSIASLQLREFWFFGSLPNKPMPKIDSLKISRAPGRRTAGGEQKLRSNYRNVPVKDFRGPLSIVQLFDLLFPIDA